MLHRVFSAHSLEKTRFFHQSILEKVKKNSEDVHRNNYDLMINSMGLNIIEALCHYYEKHSVSEYEKNTEKYKKVYAVYRALYPHLKVDYESLASL